MENKILNMNVYSSIKVIRIDTIRLSIDINKTYSNIYYENYIRATELKIGRNETFYFNNKLAIVLDTNIIIDDKGNILNSEDGQIDLPIMAMTDEINGIGEQVKTKTLKPRFYEKISESDLIKNYSINETSLSDFIDNKVLDDKKKLDKLISLIFEA